MLGSWRDGLRFAVRPRDDQSYALPSTSELLLASNIVMRVHQPPYFVDILRDGRVHFELWHWIVQRQGSPEILGMGQEKTEDEARQSAENCVADLCRDSRKKSAG